MLLASKCWLEWLVSAAAHALCHEITSVRCGRVQFDSLVIHSSGDAFYAQKQGSSLSWYVNFICLHARVACAEFSSPENLYFWCGAGGTMVSSMPPLSFTVARTGKDQRRTFPFLKRCTVLCAVACLSICSC